MTWAECPMVAFDTETTGADPLTARIVTATVVQIDGQQTSDQQWLISPGVPIPAEATAIHGITDAKAICDGVKADEAIPQIALAVSTALQAGVPVVAYNAGYDLTVLQQELSRLGMPPLEEWIGHDVRPVIDPFVIDRAVDKYRKGKRTLTAACEHYAVRLDGAHDAKQDALAAARVGWRIAQRYDDVAAMTLDQLHDWQIDCHAAWAVGFERYLAEKGTPESIDGSWPMRSMAVAS